MSFSVPHCDEEVFRTLIGSHGHGPDMHDLNESASMGRDRSGELNICPADDETTE